MPFDVLVREFSRGWINRSQFNAGLGSFSRCNNARLHHGTVEKVQGWEEITGLSTALIGEIRHFLTVRFNDGTENTLIITETNVFSWQPLTTTANITGTAWAANNERVNSGQFGNLALFTNNTRNVAKWNGTGNVADLGGLSAINVTLAKTLEVNNDHVIIGNLVVSAVRDDKFLAWSDLNLPEIWVPASTNVAGDLHFDEDATAIVRVKKITEFNVVYKERSIWFLLLVGLPFEYVKKLYTDAIGLISPEAIVEVNGVHYFVGHNLDIYKFDGINLISLADEKGIKDFILATADHNKLGEIHAGLDLELKEIYFTFDRSETQVDAWKNKFDIVYNYEEDHFTLRDSISSAKGIYTRPLATPTIDSFTTTIIDEAGRTPIDLFGAEGVPRFNLVSGDANADIFRFNFGDSFDGAAEMDGFVELGDEDFSTFIRGRNSKTANQSKQLQMLRILAESFGGSHNVGFEDGVRDSLDRPLLWKGPFNYMQDGSNKGLIKTRTNAVYHRFRFRTKNKNEWWSISGFIARIELMGESFR